MEVARAPRALRFATDAWLLALGTALPDAGSVKDVLAHLRL
jgi:hypothetical protein